MVNLTESFEFVIWLINHKLPVILNTKKPYINVISCNVLSKTITFGNDFFHLEYLTILSKVGVIWKYYEEPL